MQKWPLTFRNSSHLNVLKHLQSLIKHQTEMFIIGKKISDLAEVIIRYQHFHPGFLSFFFCLHVTVGASDLTLVLFRVQSGGSGSGQVKHFVPIQPGEKGRRVKGERLSDSWAQPPWRKWNAVKRLGAPERAELDEPRWVLKGEQIRASSSPQINSSFLPRLSHFQPFSWAPPCTNLSAPQ